MSTELGSDTVVAVSDTDAVRRLPWRRWVTITLGSALVVYGARHWDVLGWFRPETIRTLVDRCGPWGPVVYSGFKIASMLLIVPLAPVNVVAGMLYGFVWGSILNAVTTFAGAMIAFVLGRTVFRDAIQARMTGRWREFDRNVSENGLWYLMATRLTPIFPFNPMSYVAAVTSMSLRDFVWATVIGMIPLTLVHSYLGAAMGSASMGKIAVALCLVAAFSLLPVVMRRKPGRSVDPAEPDN